MKPMIIALLSGCVLVLASGCATQKTVQQRGWIGGEYAQAKQAHWLDLWRATGPTVYTFPDDLKTQQTSGIFVSAVFTDTPAAVAGLQPGDLILKIDDRPIRTVKGFRKDIDGCEPGTQARLTVFRGGRTRECTVVAGREQYEKWHSASVSLGLSGHLNLDLVPDPDFSLGVLGYRRHGDRLELHSPEEEFARDVRVREGRPGQRGGDSAEGWQTWLTVLNLKGYTRILSQQITGEGHLQTTAVQTENR